MRRTLAAAVVALSQSAAVLAQSTPLPPGVFAPLPTIGLPLPPLGLPLPPMGLSPREAPPLVPGRVAPPGGGVAHRQTRFPHGQPSRGAPAFVYVVPAYGWDYSYLTRSASPVPVYQAPAVADSRPKQGRLRLEVEPRRLLQIYIDGYYVGTADDFNGGLEAGPHVLALRAPGYEPVDVPVQVPSGDSIVYRGALRPVEVNPPAALATPSSPPPAPPVAPSTFYVIPGCYAGNVPPKEAGLPASCDQREAITLRH